MTLSLSVLDEMGKRDAGSGLATLCIDGGVGIAVVGERQAGAFSRRSFRFWPTRNNTSSFPHSVPCRSRN